MRGDFYVIKGVRLFSSCYSHMVHHYLWQFPTNVAISVQHSAIQCNTLSIWQSFAEEDFYFLTLCASKTAADVTNAVYLFIFSQHISLIHMNYLSLLTFDSQYFNKVVQEIASSKTDRLCRFALFLPFQ